MSIFIKKITTYAACITSEVCQPCWSLSRNTHDQGHAHPQINVISTVKVRNNMPFVHAIKLLHDTKMIHLCTNMSWGMDIKKKRKVWKQIYMSLYSNNSQEIDKKNKNKNACPQIKTRERSIKRSTCYHHDDTRAHLDISLWVVIP